MPIKLANNAASRLAGTLAASSTTLGVMPGDGAKFPTLAAGDWFPLTVVKADGTLEIVKCTERAADTFTITRAQEGTQAVDFSAGDRVELRLTSEALYSFRDRANHTGTQALSTITGLSTATPEEILNAIAVSKPFTTVPVENNGASILVLLPHPRQMLWSATQNKYVRAPWHPVGKISYSYGTTLDGHLPIRADLSYDKSDYPDLVEYLGLSGTGTFSLVEARGEFLRVLDNGRGVDVGRVIRSAQDYAVGPHTHPILASVSGFTSGNPAVQYAPGDNNGFFSVKGGGATFGIQSNDGTESRPRNIAFPLWLSY